MRNYLFLIITALITLLPACGRPLPPTPNPQSSSPTPQSPTPQSPTPNPQSTIPIPQSSPPTPPSLHLPLILHNPPPTPQSAIPNPQSPIPTPNFPALRAQLAQQNQTLAHVKIGFHTSLGGNQQGLDEWMRQLDTAGVPIFLKSVDNAEPLYHAQELMKQSGVPHILVYRRSGDEYDVPRYDLPPAEAARLHWEQHTAVFPPELDPNLVWLETINEPDKNRAEWLAEFALATAELALADGFRWAAFGWASGEPELADWQSPPMLRFLQLAGQHPDQIAIALHEYSYLAEDIQHEFPYKVGRFRFLFQAADAHQLPRPTVLITEWGWAYQHIPPLPQATADVAWAAELYAPHPQIKGAAIWHIGEGYADIADQVQPLIPFLTTYALTHYFVLE